MWSEDLYMQSAPHRRPQRNAPCHRNILETDPWQHPLTVPPATG